MTKTRIGNVLAVLIGFGGAFLALVALYADPPFIPAPNLAAPRNALLTVLVVGLIALLQFAGGLQARRKNFGPASPSQRPKLRRARMSTGIQLLRMQLLFIVMLVVFSHHDGWSAKSVGFDSELPAINSLLIGVGLYLVFVVLMSVALKVTGHYERVLDNNLQVLAYLWPRSRRQRLAFVLAACVLNPVVEELLFRGILVHQFDVAIGSPTVPLIVGLAASLGNHAYQGWRAITTHLPFYLIAVALLYSPTGLVGAIGFHFAGDVVPFLAMKRNLRHYRDRYRHV